MKPGYISQIPELNQNWDKIQSLFITEEIPSHTFLLNEGDISDKLFWINSGALRLWNNDDGRDITVQFFFENSGVSSFESFSQNIPSQFSIESIEKTSITWISKTNLAFLTAQYPVLKDFMLDAIGHRFVAYTNYFLSRIKDTPEKRYAELIEHNPALIARVPNIYIASYLGITPVSLSRIKKRF